jgi:hypothetical protein
LFLGNLDVVGVVTKVRHDKNFYPDGRVTRSVTFKLNDQWCVFCFFCFYYLFVESFFLHCITGGVLCICRKGFWCELTGDLVDEFRKSVISAADGLPIIVLQFARICIVQGLFVSVADIHCIVFICR